MSITVTNQSMTVDTIGSVITSDPVQDPSNSNLWCRTITFFTPPDVNGNTTIIFALKVYAASAKTQIEFSAPSQTF